MAFNGAKGLVIGDGGAVYDLEITITKVPKGKGHVQVVHLSNFWSGFQKPHDLHAMFA